MAPKTVSKKTYYISTLLFYSFCLSGLLWQVEQISENFFLFDTIKDINVFRPEEIEESSKVFYLCGDHGEFVEILRYNLVHFGQIGRRRVSPWVLEMMSFKDRFNVTYPADQIFHTTSKSIDEFMYEATYCFAYGPLWPVYFHEFRPSFAESFLVSIGHRDYPFDKGRLIKVTLVRKEPKDYGVNSNSYHLLRLPSPYTDQCFNYKAIGKLDQKDAVSDCISNGSDIYYEKIAWKKYFKFSNATLSAGSTDKNKECSNLHPKKDCDSMIFLSKILSENSDNFEKLEINFIADTEVSFSVISLPRIDTINYITYILGAMGSWIGFSFIGINPIPYFIKIAGNAVEPSINSNHNDTCAFKSILLTQRLNQTNQELVTTKNRLDDGEKKMNEQSIMIQELRSKLDQVVPMIDLLYD